MKNDVSGIKRVIMGYSKIPDEDGDCFLEVEYSLKPVDLQFLQKLFNIDPNDSEAVNRDLILCYQINKEQAEALQPYVIDGVIDLDKYDFMLECYQE